MKNRKYWGNPVAHQENLSHINIFLDEQEDVANISFQMPELREFKQFLVGFPIKEIPRITHRVCGTCAEAHRMAATKALDALFDVVPTTGVHKIRELFYMAFFVKDHATRFYALGGPNFLKKPLSSETSPTIYDVVQQLNTRLGRKVTECRRQNHRLMQMISGRKLYPAIGHPGGWDRSITPELKELLVQTAQQNIKFALFCLQEFDNIILSNPENVERLFENSYYAPIYYIGLVDKQNRVNFYDGKVRVISPKGIEFTKYDAIEYHQHIAKVIMPGNKLTFPYLRKVGWRGLKSGPNSGIYCATPLSRLNVADGMATPLAQAEFEKMYELWGRRNGKPIHSYIATQWARLIEMLYASERMLELAKDPEISEPHTNFRINNTPTEGVGIVESPRGTVIHHYWADRRGIVKRANVVVGTSNNYAALSMYMKKAAQTFVKRGKRLNRANINRFKMAIHAYDPSFFFATNSLSKQRPLEVNILDARGELVTKIA